MSDPNLPSPPPPGGSFPPPGGSFPPPPPPPGSGGFTPAPGGRPQVDLAAAFQYGWTKFTQNIGPIAIAIGVWILAQLVLSGIAQLIGNVVRDLFTTEVVTTAGRTVVTTSGGALVIFLTSAISTLLGSLAHFVGGYALLRGALAITAGRPLTTSELFNMDNFVPYLLTGVVISFAISIGTLLCLLPGLAAWFLLFLAPFHAAERGVSVGEALSLSFNLMKENWANMTLFFLGSLLLYVIGFIACCVGILVAVPVVFIAQAYMYRALVGDPVAP